MLKKHLKKPGEKRKTSGRPGSKSIDATLREAQVARDTINATAASERERAYQAYFISSGRGLGGELRHTE